MEKEKVKKDKGGRIAIFVMVDPEQKAALEALGRENERSIAFLVREAIAQYLAGLKKKS